MLQCSPLVLCNKYLQILARQISLKSLGFITVTNESPNYSLLQKGQNHFSFVSSLPQTFCDSQPLELLELVSIAKIESFSWRCLTEEAKGLAFIWNRFEREAWECGYHNRSLCCCRCMSGLSSLLEEFVEARRCLVSSEWLIFGSEGFVFIRGNKNLFPWKWVNSAAQGIGFPKRLNWIVHPCGFTGVGFPGGKHHGDQARKYQDTLWLHNMACLHAAQHQPHHSETSLTPEDASAPTTEKGKSLSAG